MSKKLNCLNNILAYKLVIIIISCNIGPNISITTVNEFFCVKGDIFTGQFVSYQTLHLKAEKVARQLIGRYRCREGDVIAIFASNSTEWIILALATFRIGAILTAFNSQLKVGLYIKAFLKMQQ